VYVLTNSADSQYDHENHWVPQDGQSTLRKSGAISTHADEGHKGPVTSTVISNVRGRSIIN
jgi:hypothetical protein